ncbi:MAG: Asp-tRNA(Asn)/Glu-tRNA(Gln) amidotransferase subunit GatA [Candidatus Pacebacteria bacterium]|nr:Asp-tRNA(Asn)/Glu-tRNA(Gln) amidotransferase subunit GatA [Candidatus Paceibacterota bacterium]
MDLGDFTIKKFHDGLLAKKFSAREAAQAYFKHIKERDLEVGAYLSLAEESALNEAGRVDEMISKGEAIGDLAGAPLAIKDAILVKGLPATAASKMLEHYTASYDAGAIKKLRAEHAVFLGKNNMDEFAMGSSTENSAYQLTHNPHDLDRVPGGSSGGSAAAVAADMALGALGSDTFGSIRIPASFCGIVGLKPTYGSVSRSGLIAMTSSLDQIGPLTKTVEDNAILFKAIAGRDPMDATSSDADYGDVLSATHGDLSRFTIGLPDEYFIGGLDGTVAKEMEAAIEKLKKLGAKFKKISLPHTKYAVPAYYLSMPAEVSSNLARFDGIRYGADPNEERPKNLLDIYLKTRGKKFGAEAKRRIILGTFVLSSGYYDAYYDKAQRVRTLVKNDFDEAFKDVDVMLTPVSPTPAFKIGEKIADPLAMYLSDVFTGPANLAGVCAISIPTKPSSALAPGELPVGFQLIGKKWHEADLFAIGRHYEKE